MAVELPSSASELGHIFREAEGHVQDTPEHRALLLLIANDATAQLAADRYGNRWSAKILEDGRQAWTQVRQNRIINGGINMIPRAFSNKTGLKRP